MSFTVSANYRDRSSAYKWLVRRTEDPIEKAVACQEVRARGVVFGPSNASEEGFGCKQVAVCESVSVDGTEVPTDLPTDWISGAINRIAFNGLEMCKLVPIESISRMQLDSDGHMYGSW